MGETEKRTEKILAARSSSRQEGMVIALRELKERQVGGVSSKMTHNADIHRFHSWSRTCWQFFRYCLVGGVNTIIDVMVLNALLWRFPTHNVQLLVLYNSVAYVSGAVSSFFLNKYWTFRRKQRPTHREVGRFLISVALEIFSSNGLLWLSGMALSPLIANVTLWGNASKLLAVAANAVFSYVCMRFWIFASGTQDRPKQPETSPPDSRRKGGHEGISFLHGEQSEEQSVMREYPQRSLSVMLPAQNEQGGIARREQFSDSERQDRHCSYLKAHGLVFRTLLCYGKRRGERRNV